MSDLFARAAVRDDAWRPEPTPAASGDPRMHPCACGAFGMFGEGKNWFCRAHVPAGFLPHTRTAPMTGSVAEERIRAKVVRQMRQYWPAGRIVHELQCGQGEHRLDVACITDDRIILAEVKSERDVLTRAEKQLGKATSVANEVWLVVASEQLEKVQTAMRYWKRPHEEWDVEEVRAEAAYYRGVKLWGEPDKDPDGWLKPDFKITHDYLYDLVPSPHAMFDLLWASEMRLALGEFFGGATLPGKDARLSRGKMTRLAVEHMSGRELRRAVCRQLRARQFPRADAPAQEVAHA